MELRSIPTTVLSGNLFSSLKQACKLRNLYELYSAKRATNGGRRIQRLIGYNIRHSANGHRSPVSCSSERNMGTHLSSNVPIQDARVLYCVAPATGHNKESHPESNLRVPAIIDALERLELSSKYRGSEVFEIKNFQPATIDDIAIVHERAYVAGLEKAMSKASDEDVPGILNCSWCRDFLG